MSNRRHPKRTADVIKLIKQRAFEGVDKDNFSPSSINKTLALANKINRKRKVYISDYILILDENINWLSEISDTLLIIVMTAKRKKKKWTAILLLLSNVVSQLISIKILLLSGLDVPAKQLVRCCVEHIDVAISLSLNDHLVGEFLRFKNIDGRLGAREFWKRFLKSRPNAGFKQQMNSKIAAELGKRNMSKWIKYINQEETILNACVHPSYIASSMNLTGTEYLFNSGEEITIPNYYGLIDRSSLRTMNFLIMSIFRYSLFGYFPKYSELPTSIKFDNMIKDQIKKSCEYIECGRLLIFGLANHHIQMYKETKPKNKRQHLVDSTS